MSENKICIIGEVIVDVTLSLDKEEDDKLRFGGVMHAARGLWALEVPYDLLFIAPEYLHDQIVDYALKHGANSAVKIGNVLGSPNIILIENVKETLKQGYRLLLKDCYQCHFISNNIVNYITNQLESIDILIFPGQYSFLGLCEYFRNTEHHFHIDIANGIETLETLSEVDKSLSIETLIISTSSKIFLDDFKGITRNLVDALIPRITKNLLFKENRGGARFFQLKNGELSTIEIDCQISPVVHSVGVGDVYNCVYLALRKKYKDLRTSLNYASWIAKAYAKTTYPDNFRKEVRRNLKIPINQINNIEGVFIPWEKRPQMNIYIAAPDFDYMDIDKINLIKNSLEYHNFTPRLPVRENGQMGVGATEQRKKELGNKDLVILHECQILIAVLLNNDPGTLIEIGYAKGIGKTVLLFDPFKLADNCMLSIVPDFQSTSLDLILLKVFSITSKIWLKNRHQ